MLIVPDVNLFPINMFGLSIDAKKPVVPPPPSQGSLSTVYDIFAPLTHTVNVLF